MFFLTCYTVAIVLNYLKNNIVTILLDRILLLLLAFLIFVNNKIVAEQVFCTLLILSVCVVVAYIVVFFLYKKSNKSFVLNFSKLSGLIESVLVLLILFLGIKNLIVVNILFFAMIDIFYKVIILEIILNLKKFSIQ